MRIQKFTPLHPARPSSKPPPNLVHVWTFSTRPFPAEQGRICLRYFQPLKHVFMVKPMFKYFGESETGLEDAAVLYIDGQCQPLTKGTTPSAVNRRNSVPRTLRFPPFLQELKSMTPTSRLRLVALSVAVQLLPAGRGYLSWLSEVFTFI